MAVLWPGAGADLPVRCAALHWVRWQAGWPGPSFSACGVLPRPDRPDGLAQQIENPSLIESLGAIVRQTLGMFLALFLGGSGLGALGGWLTGLGRRNQAEVFDRAEPQMAMNASITAVLASLFATATGS